MDFKARMWPITLLSTLAIFSGILFSNTAHAANGTDPENCVNNGSLCAVEDNQDAKAHNYCTQVADKLIDISDVNSNSNQSQSSLTHGAYNACYVGYSNGLNDTPGKEAVSICNGSAFTSGRDQSGVDFPEICESAYTAAGGSIVNAPAQSTTATCDKNNNRFLTMPAWYRGVIDENCKPSPEAVGGDFSKFIWTIVFNIVEMMLHIVAYVSGFFIVIGGYKMLTSAGSMERNAGARKTILAAVIGLIISISSIGIVNLIVINL